MNIEHLHKRIKTAYETMPLRTIANECQVSHETIRKILNNETANLLLTNYNKIDKGLKRHGF